MLGGSFNPAHDGHRHISRFALVALGLDWVWWLVTPQNPLKPVEGMAPLPVRVASARAVARHPRIVVSDLERQIGTLFTIDTLIALKRRFPHTQFVWLMGADNLLQVSHWRRWTKIFESVPVAVLQRAPFTLRALNSKAARRYRRNRVEWRRRDRLALQRAPAWLVCWNRLHAASATAIRQAVRKTSDDDRRDGDR